ncbi:MAG: lipoyl(octanoyl) transferase LipB [Bacteroidales bacterium]|jgi:lipoyl(octanoyl) transferase|nr:lipoyl(octanoyl) transferase LipB [Bacteroidales bacterium]
MNTSNLHNKQIDYIDWGMIDYKTAWEKQQALFDALVDLKSDFDSSKSKSSVQRFILCEHPHVYTLGRYGQSNNLLINDEFLRKINASYYRIDRGGDITYHGPGQIVGYPILDLEQLHLSLKEYINCLEEMIIRTLATYNIQATRMKNAAGVWLDANGKHPRKIGAVGVRASRYVTMHGFAFNVNTDLSYFSYINPCGFADKGVTSMEKELNRAVPTEEIKQKLYVHFCSLVDKQDVRS